MLVKHEQVIVLVRMVCEVIIIYLMINSAHFVNSCIGVRHMVMKTTPVVHQAG